MKTFFSLFLLLVNSLFAATEVKDAIEVPILTPSLHERKSLKLRLDNGLEAYLLSDPAVDKSGAALSVNVGSFSDPDAYPGLAHFTEHMLFLGTKKYPKEAEYQSFISKHGGQTNAFTSNDTTNYIFSVDSRYFEESLDRFSDFFKEPLFLPSGVGRELMAVDQEYAKNLQSDFIKQYSVQKELANPAHPFKRFSMGNSATLSSVSQQVLQQFYQEHYSANLMRLIVISPLPLEQLKALVIQNFEGIENKNLKPLNPSVRMTSPALDQQIVYIESLRDMRTLDLIWELPISFIADKSSRPDHLLSHILGHEGEKSLLAQLKREDLAESLSSGTLPLSHTQGLFYIEIELTEKGLKQKDTVIERAFQAINALKKAEIPPYIFQNMKDAETLRYQYQPRENVFSYLMKQIHSIQGEKLETYPIQTAITQNFDPKTFKDLIYTLDPQNAHIELVAQGKNLPPLDREENWTKTKYTVQPYQKIASFAKAEPHPQIDLPEPNPYIPQSFALHSDQKVEGMPTPRTVLASDKGVIYFAPDQQYQVPQVFWHFEIKTPKILMGDANSLVLGDLYLKMINDSLNQLSYQALLAELKFALQRTANGISLTLTGYSDKADLLFEEILQHLKPKNISEDKFKIYKESLSKQYQNFSKESTLTQGIEVLRDALSKNFTTEKEKGNALKRITLGKFNSFLANIYDEAYIEGLLYGNMKEAQAKSLGQKIIIAINASPYLPARHYKPEALKLPPNKGPFLMEKECQACGNALILTLEGNPFTFKERAAQQIGMKVLSHPFFSTLRTKQQTGYIVQSIDKEIEKQLFDLFLIQSNTHDGQDLLARAEQFIESYVQELEHECCQEEFETIKSALLHELKTPPKSLQEMGELLAALAFKFDADFDWVAKRIQGMEELTHAEFLDLSKQFLGRQNKKRLAILVKGAIPKENQFKFNRLRSMTELKQISQYLPFKGA